jgi:transitional endoplasmic reticulum ATPase
VQITPTTELVVEYPTNKGQTIGSTFLDTNDQSSQLVGGLETPMNSLREMIKLPFEFPDIFNHLGVECPKGILLKGAPGVGKTLLVNSIAKECAAKLLTINGPEVYGPYVGDSEQKLRQIFLEASKVKGPCIIFIDEIV